MNDVKIFKYELIVQRSLSMANNRTTLRDNEANLGSSKSVAEITIMLQKPKGLIGTHSHDRKHKDL